MSDWMDGFIEIQKQNKETIEDVSQKIIDLLKGVDRVGCLPSIFARVFEQTETPNGSSEYYGFNNQLVYWGIEKYAGSKLKSIFNKIITLYSYCVYNKFTESNKWEFEHDSFVCYIEDTDKKVLLFKNNTIQYVVLFDNLWNIHIREVFESLLEKDDISFYNYGDKGFNSVSELREELKSEKGLEIALANNICKYSDSFEGVKYPQRIDLNNMKKHNFGKECRSFMYGDNRDLGYIMSISKIYGKCELMNISISNYVYENILAAICGISDSYIKKEKRKNSLGKLLKNE